MCVPSHSVVSESLAHQALLSMGFSRQEYWSGLLCPTPGNISNPRIEPASLTSPALAGRFFATVPPGEFTGRSSQRSREPGAVTCSRSCSPLPLSSRHHHGLVHQRPWGRVDRAWVRPSNPHSTYAERNKRGTENSWPKGVQIQLKENPLLVICCGGNNKSK